MMIHGETVHSPLPMDLPWWMPDHFVFFGVLYIVLGVIGVALTVTVLQSLRDAKKAEH
ncbi:hypothetical protein LF599_09725 [Pseudodesulfovibrio thermohalotolerans]|jgi:hypothetical protein|uniref:hypothetical protein n=1 Tax=Pseudodesulfovibrio thermohalotolerans TaxID=2880651 RepID=UPI0024414D9F|nr:hypothetical protein [Pseudodesulfovibrio thermohalotolerans]WFS64395.1 hypothetical protein LF599_09725 [Pseudodesulfovibrio thermohalotolerans]